MKGDKMNHYQYQETKKAEKKVDLAKKGLKRSWRDFERYLQDTPPDQRTGNKGADLVAKIEYYQRSLIKALDEFSNCLCE